ncbi:MAG: YgjP-like metallopeptidase domain-containing protein [Rikenellaceae bacterium]
MATQRYNDSRIGEVLLNQTSRARRISITVLASGTVRLSFPKRISAKRALSFLDDKIDWIVSAQERVKARRVANPPASAVDKELLRDKAKSHLPDRVAKIAEITGLKYNRLTLRATTSKWGSCSSLGNISLSIYLMALPQHLIDFVILHELCHTVHLNHSADFHALVDKLCGGNEKLLSRELKSHSIK